jgi:hypothetical protein
MTPLFLLSVKARLGAICNGLVRAMKSTGHDLILCSAALFFPSLFLFFIFFNSRYTGLVLSSFGQFPFH